MSALFMKYFVLSPTKIDAHGQASRDALLEYATSITNTDSALADDINNWLYKINTILEEYELASDPSEAGERTQNVLTIDGHRDIRFLPENKMLDMSINEIIDEYIRPVLTELKHLQIQKQSSKNER